MVGTIFNNVKQMASDYESEYLEQTKSAPGPSKPKKGQGSKRKAPDSATTAPKTSKKYRGSDLFQLEGEVERLPPSKSSEDLVSTIISRVANGKVKRTAKLSGEFYIDIKVYNKAEIASSRPEERWKKANVALKLQLDKDTPQWDDLSNFMRRAHWLFDESEPVYYSDKIEFK